MASQFEQFKRLHHTSELFLLPNVWNTKSALTFQGKKFPAVATSSAAVANSLGYEDGENMPFAEYLFVIEKILHFVDIPLSVDMEMGYGKSDEEICKNILELATMGVAGINIEDSINVSSGRILGDAKDFAKTIRYIKNKLLSDGLDLFINVRCDTYILNVGNKQKETIQRLMEYESCGADGIFLPCIKDEKDIAEAVQSTSLPLNVMCIPGLPDLPTLKHLGVKRASMGPFLFRKVYETAGQLAESIVANQNFSPILS
jgi:2-methylisocitrate lyase-like PEP mutase family enzyme